MLKLAVITTHPVQYYAPVFRLLQERGRISVHVYYTAGEPQQFDRGFLKSVSWDIPLLEGYSYEWVCNTSADPGSHHFRGIVNPGLIGIIARDRPDALLIFGWNYYSHLSLMRHYKGKLPVYFRGDSTLLDRQPFLKRKLRKAFLRWIYSHVDHAFYVGRNNKDYFRASGLLDTQLTFAPHAVDNERFGLDKSREAGLFRSSLHIPDDALLVLYAGKFDPAKNLGQLISAFVALGDPQTYLVLVGNGQQEQELKELASRQAAGARIKFQDFTNQTALPAVYQAADLFCLPSASETWGLAVNEAMACRKAVLVSDRVGCAADLVIPGYNGGIFNSDDPGDLRRQLKLLTRSKASLRAHGEHSGTMIRDWNFSAIAAAIETQMLLGQPNPTDHDQE